jgi:hypothetical protein
MTEPERPKSKIPMSRDLKQFDMPVEEKTEGAEAKEASEPRPFVTPNSSRLPRDQAPRKMPLARDRSKEKKVFITADTLDILANRAKLEHALEVEEQRQASGKTKRKMRRKE